MGIELNQSDLKKLYMDLSNTAVTNVKGNDDSKVEETEVTAPENKPVTASISDVIDALSVTPTSTSSTLTSGSYTIPNGNVVLHPNNDGSVSIQFHGDGDVTLEDLNNLVSVGLVENDDSPAAVNGVNGEIDETVEQGNTGDCWLISAILSFTATEEGKALLKSAISVQENGDVVVNFKGLGVSITVTADEIKKHDTDGTFDEFSDGDNDMLVFELAVEKLFEQYPKLRFDDAAIGDTSDDRYIEGGESGYLMLWLSGNDTDRIGGIDTDSAWEEVCENNDEIELVEIPDTVEGYAGAKLPRPSSMSYDEMFNEDKTGFSDEYVNWYNSNYNDYIGNVLEQQLVDGMSEEEIIELLQSAWDSQPCAVSFGLYVFENDTVKTAKDINGKDFTFKVSTDDGTSNGLAGHAFAVVGMTEDTITFVNPWDTSEQITMTWEEFAKLGAGIMYVTTLDKADSSEESGEVDGPEGEDDVFTKEDAQAIADQLKDDLKDYINEIEDLTPEQKDELINQVNSAIDNYMNSAEITTEDALWEGLQNVVYEAVEAYYNALDELTPVKAQEVGAEAKKYVASLVEELDDLNDEQKAELINRINAAIDAYVESATEETVSALQDALEQVIINVVEAYYEELEGGDEELTIVQKLADEAKTNAKAEIEARKDLTSEQKAELIKRVNEAIDEYVETVTDETDEIMIKMELEQAISYTIKTYEIELENDTLTEEKALQLAEEAKANAEAEINKMYLTEKQKQELIGLVDYAIDDYISSATETTGSALKTALENIKNNTIDDYIAEIDKSQEESDDDTLTYDKAETIAKQIKADAETRIKEMDLNDEQKAELLEKVNLAIDFRLYNCKEYKIGDVEKKSLYTSLEKFKEDVNQAVEETITDYIKEQEAIKKGDTLDNLKIHEIVQQAKADAAAKINAMDLTDEQKAALIRNVNDAIDESASSAHNYKYGYQLREELEKVVNDIIEDSKTNGIKEPEEDNVTLSDVTLSDVIDKFKENAKNLVNRMDLTDAQKTELLNRIDSAINEEVLKYYCSDSDFEGYECSMEFQTALNNVIEDTINNYLKELNAVDEDDKLDRTQEEQIKKEVSEAAEKMIDDSDLSSDERVALHYALEQLINSFNPATESASQYRYALETEVNKLLQEYGCDSIEVTTDKTDTERDDNTVFDEKQASVIENKLRAQARALVDEMTYLSYLERTLLMNKIDDAIKSARENNFSTSISAADYEAMVQQCIDDAINSFNNGTVTAEYQIRDEDAKGGTTHIYQGHIDNVKQKYQDAINDMKLTDRQKEILINLVNSAIDEASLTIEDGETAEEFEARLEKVADEAIKEYENDALTEKEAEAISEAIQKEAEARIKSLGLSQKDETALLNKINAIITNFTEGCKGLYKSSSKFEEDLADLVDSNIQTAVDEIKKTEEDEKLTNEKIKEIKTHALEDAQKRIKAIGFGQYESVVINGVTSLINKFTCDAKTVTEYSQKLKDAVDEYIAQYIIGDEPTLPE